MDVCCVWKFINYEKLVDTEAGTFPRKETYRHKNGMSTWDHFFPSFISESKVRKIVIWKQVM